MVLGFYALSNKGFLSLCFAQRGKTPLRKAIFGVEMFAAIFKRQRIKTQYRQRIFDDKLSGTRRDRPGLERALDLLREGDTLLVWKLDGVEVGSSGAQRERFSGTGWRIRKARRSLAKSHQCH